MLAQLAAWMLMVTPPPLVEADVPMPVAPSESLTHFGVLLNAGAPDGVGASVVFRPLSWLRLQAGATTAAFSTGFTGGVTFVPFRTVVTPTLTVEGGYLPPGNLNPTLQKLTGNPSFQMDLFNSVSYSYGNAHLGLEIGSQRRFSFFLHLGASALHASFSNFQQSSSQQSQSSSQTAFDVKSPNVNVILPSAKLGFILYFV